MPVKKYDKPNKTIQCIRLLKILKSQHYVKKNEIAYLLGEQTTRNINNYKNTLYDAGYPIHYKSGRYGGYYLENDGMLPSASLDEDQIKSLRTSYEYLLKESQVPNKQLLMDYLGNLFLEKENNFNEEQLALYGHFPLSMPRDEIERRYYIIQTAIDSKRKIKVLYRGYNADSERILHPYKLFKFSNWLLFAKRENSKQDNNVYSNFKLHRMLTIELLDETYELDPTYDESDHFDKSGTKDTTVHLKLRVYGKMGRFLDEKIHGENQVVKCLDEKKHIYSFEADMKNELVIRKFILSFGSRCEVLEPLEIREEMIRDAKQTLYRYEKN